jgi:hypothetical protein
VQGRLGRVRAWVAAPVQEKVSAALRGRSGVSRAAAAEARAAPVREDFEAGAPDQEAHPAWVPAESRHPLHRAAATAANTLYTRCANKGFPGDFNFAQATGVYTSIALVTSY